MRNSSAPESAGRLLRRQRLAGWDPGTTSPVMGRAVAGAGPPVRDRA